MRGNTAPELLQEGLPETAMGMEMDNRNESKS